MSRQKLTNSYTAALRAVLMKLRLLQRELRALFMPGLTIYRQVLPLALLFIAVTFGSLAWYLSGDRRPTSNPMPSSSVELQPILPVRHATDADVISRWGDRRDGGRRRHRGIDIRGHEGAHVIAPLSGVVVRRGRGANAGNYLWLMEMKGEYLLIFMHLKTFQGALDSGSVVLQGETIGFIGSTGNAGSPHLHFEVARLQQAFVPGSRKSYLDPLTFLHEATEPAKAAGSR